MAKAELGTKRLCANCGAKFYDLNKDPIHCPKCGTVHVVAPVVTRAPRPEPAPPVAPRPPVAPVEEVVVPEPAEVEAHQGAQQRAFAGTGATEDYQRLTGADVKADAMQDFALAIIHAQVAHGDRGAAVGAALWRFHDRVGRHSPFSPALRNKKWL